MSDRRYKITYTAPSGEQWELSSHEWLAGLKAGGITGLVGQAEATTQESLEESGVRVSGFRNPQITGSLNVLVRGTETESATDVWVRFRRAFPIQGNLGVLTIESPDTTVTAFVRTPGGLSNLDVDSNSNDHVSMEVPLIIDQGHWWLPVQTGTSSVTVTNSGDTYVWPKIRWTGAGGEVTLPSGAKFTLPAVGSERVLDLWPRRSREVLAADGTKDHALWVQLRGQPISEGVPPGGGREFKLPAGAVLEWQMGVLDPWR